MSTEPPPTLQQQSKWLIRLKASLDPWQRPAAQRRFLEPAVAARELLIWSEDDGRWNPRAKHDWWSLLDDIDASWSRLGPRLSQVAGVDTQLAELREVRAAKTISVADHRVIVTRVARALEVACDAPDALIAAVDDVFVAAQGSSRPDSLNDETHWCLALLAWVGERHGHDWAVVADRVRRGLEWTSGQPFDQSVRAVHRALRTPAGCGHSIVWLVVNHAWAWGPSPNPTVQLFNGEWLLGVLREWKGPREGVPAELAANPQQLVEACPRFDEDSSPDEQLPVTFVRIDLGEGPTAGVRDRAQETLELLVARASAQQGGTNWKISGVCLHFVDGELIFEATGPVGDPDIYRQLGRTDIVNDPTGTAINEQAERLHAHLPVSDSRLHTALQLSEWLTQARRSSPPARLVLSGRIIEQTANWAEVPVRTLLYDHLALAWAWNRIAGDLSRAGAAAVLRLRGATGGSSTDESRQMFLDVRQELIEDRHDRGRPRARPWKVLARLDWLAEQHPSDTEIGDYLRELQQHVANGAATAAWIDELCGELMVLNARAVRIRNAIVHGGPLVTSVAETVVNDQDALGSQALEWTIDGLAAERALPEVFAEHRTRYAEALERLRVGGDPTVHLTTAAAP